MLGLFNFLGARYGLRVANNTFLYGLPLGCLVLGMALGAWGGWVVGRMPLQAELAEHRTQTAEVARLRAMAAARALAQAQTQGDRLTQRLVTRQADITRIEKDKRDATQRFTTGQPCFSGTAVRVLNTTPDGTGATAGVSQATSGAAAADGAFATDTDVWRWIGHAQARYGECRSRLDALIDWDPQGGMHFEN